jgi:NAD(P)-dependent dehydrogenase (short-subunit alcohol dehydrogenase family)
VANALEALWSLDGRVMLVTGSSKGIGEATARLLAAAGATVVISSRNAAECEAVARSIRDAGGRAIACAADLRASTDAVALPARVVQAAGRLDAVVNNAGSIIRKDAVTTTADEWQATFTLHVTAAAQVAGAAARHLAASSGSIVNVASTHGLVASPGRAAYAAAKAALVHLTRVLAVELAPLGIRVNGVAPGIVETPLTREMLADPGTRERLVARIPLGRPGLPDDVARAILFLVSPAAEYITGHVLAVDGGRSIAG